MTMWRFVELWRGAPLPGDLLLIVGLSTFGAVAQIVVINAVATLTWRFIEQPSQEIGRRLRCRLERHRLAWIERTAPVDAEATGAR